MKKALATIAYGIGTSMVGILVCIFFSHSSFVPFPDAMIPTTLYELVSEWLALGTVPMLIICFLMKNTCEAKGKDAVLIFIPSAICGAALIFWITVMAIGIIRL